MDDLRKRYEKTPPPSFLSGKPFKRPFGNKDKPSLIYLCFPNGLYFSDDLLKHAAANNGQKSKSAPAALPIEKQRQSKHLVFIRICSFQTTFLPPFSNARSIIASRKASKPRLFVTEIFTPTARPELSRNTPASRTPSGSRSILL